MKQKGLIRRPGRAGINGQTSAAGFTLMELLVVIAIIGILSVVILVYLGSARAQSRDARRLDDMHQIQSALELYYNTCGGYPPALDTAVSDGCPDGTTFYTFMQQIPVNPTPNGTDYVYTPDPDNDTYSVSFTTETSVGNLEAGPHTMEPGGIR